MNSAKILAAATAGCLLLATPARAQMTTPGVSVGIPNGLSGPGGTETFTPAPAVGADQPVLGNGALNGRAFDPDAVVRQRPGVQSDQRR